MRSFAWVVGFVVLTVMLAMARWSPPPDPLVADAQRFLADRQLYSGAVTGLYDRDTAAAVRRFQMLHEMRVTGRLDPGTTARMHLPEYTPAPEIVEQDRRYLQSLDPPPVAEKKTPEGKNLPLREEKDPPAALPKGG